MIQIRSWIEFGREMRDIWKSLFLVYDQILDNRQVFRLRLLYEMCRSIAIRSGIVHMDVHITAYPFGRLVRNVWTQLNREAYRRVGLHFCPTLLEPIFEPAHDIDLHATGRHPYLGNALSVEVVR